MPAAKHNDVPHCHVRYADALGQVQQQVAPLFTTPPTPLPVTRVPEEVAANNMLHDRILSCRLIRQHLKLTQKHVQLQTAAAGMVSKKCARSVASSSTLKRPVSGITRWAATTGDPRWSRCFCQCLISSFHSVHTLSSMPVMVMKNVHSEALGDFMLNKAI